MISKEEFGKKVCPLNSRESLTSIFLHLVECGYSLGHYDGEVLKVLLSLHVQNLEQCAPYTPVIHLSYKNAIIKRLHINPVLVFGKNFQWVFGRIRMMLMGTLGSQVD